MCTREKVLNQNSGFGRDVLLLIRESDKGKKQKKFMEEK